MELGVWNSWFNEPGVLGVHKLGLNGGRERGVRPCFRAGYFMIGGEQCFSRFSRRHGG